MAELDRIPTPHIEAKAGDFADLVLMPGDPLRAKYVAEHYFEDARLVTSVRNVLGYTGTYKGKRVSVMASGMGYRISRCNQRELQNHGHRSRRRCMHNIEMGGDVQVERDLCTDCYMGPSL